MDWTRKVNPVNREKYLGAGFNDYLTKPIFDENILLDAIQRFLPDGPAAPAGAHTGETENLNPSAIERLVRLGGEKFAGDMIDLFFSYGGKKIAEARQAQQAGKLVALADAVHPLKSSAGNVGAVLVQELAKEVESSAREQNAELAGTQLNELECAYAAAKKLLELEKAKLPLPPALPARGL